MNITVTTKTGFSNRPVIPVEPTHPTFKSRNATQKWKENDYITKDEELTQEEREAVASEPVKTNTTNMSIQDIYEMENSKSIRIREELQGKKR